MVVKKSRVTLASALYVLGGAAGGAAIAVTAMYFLFTRPPKRRD